MKEKLKLIKQNLVMFVDNIPQNRRRRCILEVVNTTMRTQSR